MGEWGLSSGGLLHRLVGTLDGRSVCVVAGVGG